nr:hypothetical protein [Tanacetum cinerariifolium]
FSLAPFLTDQLPQYMKFLRSEMICWLAVVDVEMMDGVIVDWGEGIGVTVDEPVVKMDSIPGSIIRFNRLVTNDDVEELSC